MSNFIEYVGEFSTKDFLLSLFILLFCLRQMGDLLEWFFSKTGIETKSVRRVRAAKEQLDRHEQMLAEISKSLNAINTKLEELSEKTFNTEKTADVRRMKELRKSILSFANEMKRQEYDKEMCEDIFEAHDEYDELVKKWHEKNGRTTRAMNEIMDYYHKLP